MDAENNVTSMRSDLMNHLEQHRFGSKETNGFELFPSSVYSSPDKMRCLLTAYAAMSIRRKESMRVADLELNLEFQYKRLTKIFYAGYGESCLSNI